MGPAFVTAFNEFINSELGKKAPGLIRLVASRAGGENSHAVLFTAPSFEALNKYMDSLPGTKDMESFVSKVGEISAPAGTSISRIVKVWK